MKSKNAKEWMWERSAGGKLVVSGPKGSWDEQNRPTRVPLPRQGTAGQRLLSSRCRMLSSSLCLFLLFVSISLIRAADPCGDVSSDYVPCVGRTHADHLFQHCCRQYAPAGCQDLCRYESNELITRKLLSKALLNKGCKLKDLGTVLYCASQNQDNRECCRHLKLADGSLGVGSRCLRFCDPAGEGIYGLTKDDATCLFNWNVLMYCHHSGIPFDSA